MKIQLIVFSGRKNTSWLIDEDDGKKVYEQLRVLPGTLMTWEHSEYIGYRGIEVILDATEKMKIYKGLVEVTSGDEVRRFMDYNRDLESWLLDTGKPHIEEPLFNQILSEIKG